MTRTDRTKNASTRRIVVALTAAAVLGAVMSVAVADEKQDAVPEAAMKEAQEIFNTRCSVCHGMSGKGDGPGSAILNPKPRNFTDSEWQKTVSDDHIEKIIQYGGAAVAKSPMMPNNPDLIAKPDVVKGIRTVVRKFGHTQ